MAVLHNLAKNLRLSVELVDREVPVVIPGQPPPPADLLRVLGSAGLEFFDRRDQSFWPFIRLPVVYYGGTDAPALVNSIREVCSLRIPGFAFRTGTQGDLALQVGRQNGGTFVVEVGIDLATYLVETSGIQGEPGHELAMFRFNTNTAELVIFADQLKQELERLPPVKKL
jgi:hypothetical protein